MDQLTIDLPGDPAPDTLAHADGRTINGWELCSDSGGKFCTKFPGHDGLHVLDNGTTIIEVWS